MQNSGGTAMYLCSLWIVFLLIPAGGFTQTVSSASLQGAVTDPSGARIPDATVQITGPGGQQRKTTDATGQYAFAALRPGTYLIRVIARNFSVEEKPDVAINGAVALDFQLQIADASAVINVEAESDKVRVNVDPDANASAIVIAGKDLDSLSDDPDELAQQLQTLAGPGAGPQGGQIYIDGFAGGPPPKSAIREVRINANPFSAEYDSFGFGRIEILTKPGADAFHGQFSEQYNN